MSVILLASGMSASAAVVNLLQNGMPVLVQEDSRFPLVSIRLYVHAGSAYEEPQEAGISHILEHMVFKGTAKRAPGEVAGVIEGAGGYINAATSFDHTVYKIDLPEENWKLGLDVLEDMIFGATVDAGELEQEKQVILSELERGEDSPQRKLFLSMQPLVWPNTSYERPVIGFRDTIKSIQREDILSYIQRLYLPQKMLLVVCGNVDKDQVLSEANTLFGSRKNTSEFVSAQPAPLSPELSQEPEIVIESGPWKKAYLAVAFPIPGFRAEDAPALEVLGHLLGGDQTSLLYKKLKYELQLVDEIAVSPVMLERGGIFYIQAQMDPDNVEIFWDHLIRELSELKGSSFSGDAVKRAKFNLEDSLFQTMETLGGLSTKLGFFQFFENGLEAEDQYLYTLRHLDTEQIQEVIEKYLQPSLLRASLMVPEEVSPPKSLLLKKLESSWSTEKTSPLIKEKGKESGEKEIFDLGHGRKLIFLPDTTLPYTGLTMTFTGGDSLLFPEEQGLADLTSRVLTRGTQSMSATQYREYLADRAAHLDAYAGRESFTISAKFLSRHTDDILGLLEETLFKPDFVQDEINRSKNDQIAEIKEREDQPAGLLFRNVFPFLFKEHPYGYYHLGEVEGIAGFEPDQVEHFWDRQRVQPWTLAVCGNLDRKKIKQFADKLASHPTDSRVQTAMPPWSEEKSKVLHLSERNQAHLLVIFPVPGIDGADSPDI
ncbi:MAG: M16 family metallopeptidase, partial [Desulfovibrionales bacterium]